jgi:hypothetical protein
MANLKILHDVEGRTLTVWFAPPESEAICEETGDEVILMKNKEGRVIGFEKLNYVEQPGALHVAFEAINTLAAP